jgi:hypothetical protein
MAIPTYYGYTCYGSTYYGYNFGTDYGYIPGA